MSDTTVIVICSAMLLAVAAIAREGPIGPVERILYNAVAVVSVSGIAARSARAMGQTWFSARSLRSTKPC